MVSKALIQTVRADFLDSSLYDDPAVSGLPHLSRGTLLAAFSHAFDLAEGRKPGHAQRVAYIGLSLASEMGLREQEVEDVFFACLLHDVGMSGGAHVPTVEAGRGAKLISGTTRASEVLAAVPSGGWAEILGALAAHCDLGSTIVRRMGFRESVVRAVADHHDCWDGSSPNGNRPGHAASTVSRVVAAADRIESMIDAEGSALLVRRRGPALVRDMAGSELDPVLAEKMVVLAARDEFWLGFYDNDLAAWLMTLDLGGVLSRDELFELVGVVGDVVDHRNGREAGTARRISDLARRVALACEVTDRRADLVKIAALLQDVGTLGVPAQHLCKPDILTIEEMSAVQMHPTFARDILSEVPGFGAAAWWVGCHHERIDGKGYPGMLEGDEVPAEAQIIGMCEAFDALTSDRPYRRAMSVADAIDVMRGLGGTRFDPGLLERFERVVAPLGS